MEGLDYRGCQIIESCTVQLSTVIPVEFGWIRENVGLLRCSRASLR
jgi:hypothetical protein